MGGGISSLSFLSEHKELVARLKASFADNDGNKEIIANIARLRHVLSERPDICTTAKREIGLTFWPTNLASAKLEFDRLMRIYEDSMHRKSVVGRNQATCGCPLGHFCEKYRGKMGQCSLCSVKCTSGNSCSYCGYNLCDTCSIIYCHGKFYLYHSNKLISSLSRDFHVCRGPYNDIMDSSGITISMCIMQIPTNHIRIYVYYLS